MRIFMVLIISLPLFMAMGCDQAPPKERESGAPPAEASYFHVVDGAVKVNYVPPSDKREGVAVLSYDLDGVFPPTSILDEIESHLVADGWYKAEVDLMLSHRPVGTWNDLRPPAAEAKTKNYTRWWIRESGETLTVDVFYWEEREATRLPFSVTFIHRDAQEAAGLIRAYLERHSAPWAKQGE